MLSRLLPWLLALAVFVGVGLFVVDNQGRTALRNAEAVRDTCYAEKGFSDLSSSVAIPEAVITECTQPVVEATESPAPFVIGGIAGLIAAAVVLGLAVLFRRRKAA